MKAVFVESSIFEKHRSAYLPDDEFQQFQNDLLENPLVGDVIQGTGGLRKVRVGIQSRGKRGGARVIYYYDSFQCFYLLTIYAKNEMSHLTADQKHQLKTFVEVWRNE